MDFPPFSTVPIKMNKTFHRVGEERCGNCRYVYMLHLNPDKVNISPLILGIIMCNPSKADLDKSDRTIESVVRFAEINGYNQIIVTNVCPVVDTDMKNLKKYINNTDLYDIDYNMSRIKQMVVISDTVVYAWGNDIWRFYGKQEPDFLRDSVSNPMCINKTEIGAPNHPLYKKAGKFVQFRSSR